MGLVTYLINPNYGSFTLRLFIFLLLAGVLIFVITIHEFAHALAATLLGDPTAKANDRLTLDPRAHLDRLGTLLLLLVGFGWGRPVPFNPDYFANPRRDSAIVSLAGPLSNFLFACIFGFFYQFFPYGVVKEVLGALVTLNLVLCFFNLIPVNPLDGFKVVWGFLPENLAHQWLDLAPYGIYILLILIFSNVTDKFISIPVNFFINIL